MSFLYVFISGIIIGSAMIAPGLSGGVIAVILGIYNDMIESLYNLFKDFKKNFIFLLILSLGVMIGALIFSKILMYLYVNYEVIIKFLFMGLIIGGIPFLYKEIILKKEKLNLIMLFITTLLCLIILFISKYFFEIGVDKNYSTTKMLISGFIYSIGKVIPGISGSFLLIILGMYKYILGIFANPFSLTYNDIINLIPFIIGFIIGIIVFLKIINYLLKYKFGITYSVIMGFVIGSIPAIIPKIRNFYEILIGFFSLLIGFLASYLLINKKK